MDGYKDNGKWTTRRTMGQQQGLWTPKIKHTRTEDNDEENRQWTTRRMMDYN